MVTIVHVYQVIFIYTLLRSLAILFNEPSEAWSGRSWDKCEELILTAVARCDLDFSQGSHSCNRSGLVLALDYPAMS